MMSQDLSKMLTLEGNGTNLCGIWKGMLISCKTARFITAEVNIKVVSLSGTLTVMRRVCTVITWVS